MKKWSLFIGDNSAYPISPPHHFVRDSKVAAIGSPPQQEEGWPEAGVVWSSDSSTLSCFQQLDPD